MAFAMLCIYANISILLPYFMLYMYLLVLPTDFGMYCKHLNCIFYKYLYFLINALLPGDGFVGCLVLDVVHPWGMTGGLRMDDDETD